MNENLEVVDAFGDSNEVEVMLEEKVVLRSDHAVGATSSFGLKFHLVQ